MFIDAHCHLERETYGDEVDAVVARALAAGLSHLVAVGASRGAVGAHEAVALAQRLPPVYATVGIHPHDAEAVTAASMAELDGLLRLPKVVAVGEVGLDYYYEHAPREVQRRAFTGFLEQAQIHNLPIMLHIRNAHADCLELLDAVGLPSRGGVIHCFTGGSEEAAAYLERGMYLSIPGVVTFKTALPLRQAVPEIPADRLLLETDCPYLTPAPHRGKRNEPALMLHTAAAVAALRQVSLETLGTQTHANTCRLFGLPAAAAPLAPAA